MWETPEEENLNENGKQGKKCFTSFRCDYWCIWSQILTKQFGNTVMKLFGSGSSARGQLIFGSLCKISGVRRLLCSAGSYVSNYGGGAAVVFTDFWFCFNQSPHYYSHLLRTLLPLKQFCGTCRTSWAEARQRRRAISWKRVALLWQPTSLTTIIIGTVRDPRQAFPNMVFKLGFVHVVNDRVHVSFFVPLRVFSTSKIQT